MAASIAGAGSRLSDGCVDIKQQCRQFHQTRVLIASRKSLLAHSLSGVLHGRMNNLPVLSRGDIVFGAYGVAAWRAEGVHSLHHRAMDLPRIVRATVCVQIWFHHPSHVWRAQGTRYGTLVTASLWCLLVVPHADLLPAACALDQRTGRGVCWVAKRRLTQCACRPFTLIPRQSTVNNTAYSCVC